MGHFSRIFQAYLAFSSSVTSVVSTALPDFISKNMGLCLSRKCEDITTKYDCTAVQKNVRWGVACCKWTDGDTCELIKKGRDDQSQEGSLQALEARVLQSIDGYRNQIDST